MPHFVFMCCVRASAWLALSQCAVSCGVGLLAASFGLGQTTTMAESATKVQCYRCLSEGAWAGMMGEVGSTGSLSIKDFFYKTVADAPCLRYLWGIISTGIVYI